MGDPGGTDIGRQCMSQFDGVINLGGLYCRNVPLPRPTRPWIIDLSEMQPYPGIEPGNAADFTAAPEMQHWQIGDTPDDLESQLRWVKVQDRGRTLLICDRVILFRVSWDDLDRAGFVNGRSISVNGSSYRCRLLTGGSRFRVESEGRAGGAPDDNEWDRWVVNEALVPGLPSPTRGDLDDAVDLADRSGVHNRLWNWVGAHSWTQTPYENLSTARCCRGYHSANYFYLNTQSHRHEDIGWRPVLEPIG